MNKTTVAVVVALAVLILLAGVALRGGGGTLSRWVASFHANAGH